MVGITPQAGYRPAVLSGLQAAPAPASVLSGTGHVPGLLGMIARWCEALQGQQSVASALDAVALAIGANAVVLTRAPVKGDRAARSLVHSVAAAKLTPRPLAPRLVGAHAATAELHLASGSTRADVLAELSGSGSAEVAALVLAHGKEATDYLELHLPRRLDNEQRALIDAALPTMVSAWANRAPGRIEQSLSTDKCTGQGGASADLLSPDNPAGLTRAEFRVCLLLAQGLPIAAISEALGLAVSTVRSHLRNIYSKTGATGHAALVYRLLSNPSLGSDDVF